MPAILAEVCDCNFCKRNQQFKEALGRVPEQDKKFWENFYEKLFYTEDNLNYYKALVCGCWPESDKTIHNFRSAKLHSEKGHVD